MGAASIMSVLSKTHASGSLEYWGDCHIGVLPDFPRLKTNVQAQGSPLETLREIFADDPVMRINTDAKGRIRMVESDVPEDLLEVRIKRVSFAPESEFPWEVENAVTGRSVGLYSPADALRHILSTPEVVNFRKAHSIGPFDFEQTGGPDLEISAPSPHISGELTDVKLSEALDSVLTVFPGIWIYENCPSTKSARDVYFQFYQNASPWDALQTGKRH